MNKQAFVLAVMLGFVFSVTARAETFYAYLEGRQEVPAGSSTAKGYARIVVDAAAGTIAYTVVFNGLSSPQTASHIHAPAPLGANAAIAINFGAVGGTSGTITGTGSITPTQISQLRAHQGYVNVHTSSFPAGEIRGQLGIKRPVDLDGDGRQDYSVWRFPNIAPPAVAQITYWTLNSTSGVTTGAFGDANRDFPTPGDYDGDGKDDVALYRDGVTDSTQGYFYVLRSSDNTAQSIKWGFDGDQAVCRDYDGDGITDAAVFRRGPSQGTQAFWYIKRSTGGPDLSIPFGTTGDAGAGNGDTPVPGDYDGDGKFDLAVYRFGGLSPNNTFIVLRSSDGVASYQQWGNFNSDYVLPGDYDGDGKYDYAVARAGATSTSPLNWYILQSSNSQLRATQWGRSSDTPTQGDYDGDGRADISVYRQGATAGSQSFFYTLGSFDNAFISTPWGIRNDFAVNSFDTR